jgi:methanogenic corrinoid protein MtbC1
LGTLARLARRIQVSSDILEKLERAVLDCDDEGAGNYSRKLVEDGVDPMIGMEVLVDTIKKVGENADLGEVLLEDLTLPLCAMTAAMLPLEEALLKSNTKRSSLGVVVLGTVAGHRHFIGRSWMGSLLTAAGFEVRDLGVDVPVEESVTAVRQQDADRLVMSILLAFTVQEAQPFVEALAAATLRDGVKVLLLRTDPRD